MQSKRLLQQFVVTLVAIAVALAAYYFIRRPDIATRRAQTAELTRGAAALKQQSAALLQSSAEQADKLSQRAQALGNQASALRNEVAKQQRQATTRKEKFLAASFRAEGLQMGATAKLAIAEHYMATGKLASSNAQVGLPAPAQFKGRSVRSMRISEGGVITLTYDAKSGIDGGAIQLVPEHTLSSRLRWRCVSPDFHDIAETIPQCSYQ